VDRDGVAPGGKVMLDELIPLVVLLLVAFPIASIVSLVVGLGTRGRLAALERRLGALEASGRDRTAVQRLDARLSVLEAAGGPSDTGGAAREIPSAPQGGPPRAAEVGIDAPGADGVSAPEPAASPPVAPPASAGAAPEDAPALPPPPSASVPPVSPPPPAAPGLEERFGTRWVVWAGGLALALGGIFMVRYAIEEGWIGPAVRVALGAALGVALIAASEWLRRKENLAGIAGPPAAHIPSILTAAGTTVCYATVFAAYALYGFIDPAAAFVVLAIVALATLGAALLHGPTLAALGLVGAEVTPILVTAKRPSYWALYVFLAVVTAAAFALARLRLWRWLAVTAVAFGMAWALAGLSDPGTSGIAPNVFHAAAGFALAALIVVAGLFFGPDAVPGRVDALSSGAIAAYLLLAALVVTAHDGDAAALLPFTLLVAATVAIAWRTNAAAAALPAAALLSALVIVAWAVAPELGHLVVPDTGLGPEASQADIVLHLVLGAFFAALFGGAGYLAQGRYAQAVIPLIWSATAVLAPLAILVALYYGIHGLERSLPFAAIALGLAAWFAVAAEWLTKREPRPGVPAAAALHAAGSVSALALALTFSLEKGWLTVGLALMAPGIAWVANKRPLPLLRWLAAAAAVLVLARIAWEPRIVGDDLGTALFFNWLLYGYGVPALAFWGAGWLLRCRADDTPSRIVDAAAILFVVLFAALQIRHAVNGGDIYAIPSGLSEAGLQVCAGLAMAIGLERLRRRTHNVVHNAGALIIAAVTLLVIVTELFGLENPRLTGRPVGDAFLNLVLLGYGLPAVLAITLALVARRTRPMPYRMGAAAVSVLLALAYLTLETMRLYHGPRLTGAIGDAESYTFSAVWLAFGVVLLAVGVPLDSKPTRLASAAVVGLTTAKVFLIDLSSLGGIWRALSFIGLGLVLVGIGWLYQRLLFPRRPAAAS
jgi:uncharacterized membrane protein